MSTCLPNRKVNADYHRYTQTPNILCCVNNKHFDASNIVSASIWWLGEGDRGDGHPQSLRPRSTFTFAEQHPSVFLFFFFSDEVDSLRWEFQRLRSVRHPLVTVWLSETCDRTIDRSYGEWCWNMDRWNSLFDQIVVSFQTWGYFWGTFCCCCVCVTSAVCFGNGDPPYENCEQQPNHPGGGGNCVKTFHFVVSSNFSTLSVFRLFVRKMLDNFSSFFSSWFLLLSCLVECLMSE